MIDQIDQQLQTWIQETLRVPATLSDPIPPPKKPAIVFSLIELSERPALRSLHRPPLQITLHYLITAWDDSPIASHRLLGELIFAALEHPTYEVALDPLPTALWTAFGATPRPAFILRVPLRRDRPEPAAPLVRVPLNSQLVPLAHLEGRILGNGDIPLVGAVVEYPTLSITTSTDSQGCFRLPDLPAEPDAPRRLRIQARERQFEITFTRLSGQEPLVIRLDLLTKPEEPPASP
jgi:hypothetical protein